MRKNTISYSFLTTFDFLNRFGLRENSECNEFARSASLQAGCACTAGTEMASKLTDLAMDIFIIIIENTLLHVTIIK